MTDDDSQVASLFADLSHDAFIVRDIEDCICVWSEGAVRLYGWCADEAKGRNFYDFLFPAAFQDLRQQSRILAETGEWMGELRQVTRSGQEIIVHSRWKLQRDASGRARSVLIANQDVTEKKILEKALLQRQRAEAVGEIASAVAHDLNNVLATMLISIRGLRQEHSLESLQFHAEHAGRLVTQLLSLAGEAEIEMHAVDLAYVLAETEKILISSFPSSIRIAPVVAKDLRVVRGNGTELYQMLMNLCINARDAMPDGGTLTIEAANVTLREAPARSLGMSRGEYVVLKVSDTGIGVPPEIAEKIFDPFFTTKRPGRGMGLGLYSVTRIVSRHNGCIRLSSGPKQGAQFAVYLPVERMSSYMTS